VKSRLAGPGPGPDQMVAVMDAEGASSWQVRFTEDVAPVKTQRSFAPLLALIRP